MSEQVMQEMETVAEEQPAPGSLAARMARRGEQLQNQRTEMFEVPGWEDILAVELRMLGYEESRKIGRRLSKVRDVAMQELYSFADQIIAATEGFFEVVDGQRRPVDRTWMQLAREGVARPLPEDLTPRQAIIALLGDRRVAYLFNSWEEWMQGERPEVDEEVMRDFGRTP